MTHVGAWVMCPDTSSLFRSRQYLRLRCLPHCMHNWRLQHLKSCPRNYFKRRYVMGQRCRMRCYNAIYATMQQAATVAILQSTIANVSQQQLCEMGSHIMDARGATMEYCTRWANGVLCATDCDRQRGIGQLLSPAQSTTGYGMRQRCIAWCAELGNCYHRAQSTTGYGVRQRSIAWYASIACHNT